jgi:hypothetical protein
MHGRPQRKRSNFNELDSSSVINLIGSVRAFSPRFSPFCFFAWSNKCKVHNVVNPLSTVLAGVERYIVIVLSVLMKQTFGEMNLMWQCLANNALLCCDVEFFEFFLSLFVISNRVYSKTVKCCRCCFVVVVVVVVVLRSVVAFSWSC